MPRLPRFKVFKMRRLGIHEQACRHREGRPLRGFGQPRKPQRPADTHRTLQDARREIGDAGELTAAAGQNDSPPRLRRERRSDETVAHHFQNFFDARLDDARERRTRNELRRLALVIAEPK